MIIPNTYFLLSKTDGIKFHLIDVGQGLMFILILPNDFTILYDCNVTSDNKERVLSFLESVLPSHSDSSKRIDLFINSHRDDDHLRGLNYINDKYPIVSIWDSGQTGESTQSSQYQYYMRLRRTVKAKNGDNSVLIPRPSILPVLTSGQAKIYCLNSSYKFSETESYFTDSYLNRLNESHRIDEVKKAHTNCIVLRIEFNNTSILLAGDSDYISWRDEIIPSFSKYSLIQSEILIASHHGSRSFFTSEANKTIDYENNPETTYLAALDYISPSITLISCGLYKTFHHPNKEALQIYKNKTTNGQVYTTNNHKTLCGFIKNNNDYGINPQRFNENGGDIFYIEAKYYDKIISNNSTLYVGGTLYFTVKPKQHGILEPFSEVIITWEVSNNGTGMDSKNNEIYYKGETERGSKYKFNRTLSYKGKHLLRCRLYNKSKRLISQKIFVVNAI